VVSTFDDMPTKIKPSIKESIKDANGKPTNRWRLKHFYLKQATIAEIHEALEKGKLEWERQLNVLDYLIRNNQSNVKNSQGQHIEVKSMSIMAILRDWSKMKVMTSKNYPRKQVVMIPIKRWTPEEQDNYVAARIQAHQQAEQSGGDICSAEERWAKPDTYAIMKDGRKTALRVLENKEQVRQYLEDNKLKEGKGITVVFRKGEDVRCQHYCRVNSFCDYFTSKSVAF